MRVARSLRAACQVLGWNGVNQRTSNTKVRLRDAKLWRSSKGCVDAEWAKAQILLGSGRTLSENLKAV